MCAVAAGYLSVPLSPAKTPYNRGFSKIRREKLVPIYAYRCEACGFAKDALQKVSDAPLTDCPACGEAFWGVAGLCPDCREPAPEYRKKEAK